MNLYTKLDGVRPESVSFMRPQDTGTPKMYNTRGLDRLLLEAEDYTYKYISDADLDSLDSVAGAKLLVVPGHSEYWTETARRNFDRFVDDGGTALVLSGNTMFRAVGYDDAANPTELTFHPRIQFTSPAVGYPTWESIGVDFLHGGNGSGYRGARDRILNPHDGWKILSEPSYLEDAGVEVGDVIYAPAAEYDGVPYTECDPETGPVIDTELLGFHQIDLVAFENATYGGQRPTCAAWIDFRKTETSGRQITVGAFNAAFFGSRTGALQSKISSNMIDLLLMDRADFDRDERLSIQDIDGLSAAMHLEDPNMMYDMNSDGRVDVADQNRWVSDFAKTVPGDTNLDGRVDFTDFLQFSAHFAATGAVWSQGDSNGDGLVDFTDFLAISLNYTNTLTKNAMPQAVPVPEPSSLALVIGGLSLLLAGRKRER